MSSTIRFAALFASMLAAGALHAQTAPVAPNAPGARASAQAAKPVNNGAQRLVLGSVEGKPTAAEAEAAAAKEKPKVVLPPAPIAAQKMIPLDRPVRHHEVIPEPVVLELAGQRLISHDGGFNFTVTLDGQLFTLVGDSPVELTEQVRELNLKSASAKGLTQSLLQANRTLRDQLQVHAAVVATGRSGTLSPAQIDGIQAEIGLNQALLSNLNGEGYELDTTHAYRKVGYERLVDLKPVSQHVVPGSKYNAYQLYTVGEAPNNHFFFIIDGKRRDVSAKDVSEGRATIALTDLLSEK